MRELMADVFESLRSDGFRHVFCFSGHGDVAHNRAILEGIRLGVERSGIDISFVADAALVARLGLGPDDPQITLHASGSGAPPKYVDVHAGQWETSMMMCACPALVRDEVRRGLRSTDYGADDLAEWRRGPEHARRKTPLGYFGDPAGASVEEGAQSLRSSAERAADAIEARLKSRPPAAAAR
jgi:creatinine amidohydrolase